MKKTKLIVFDVVGLTKSHLVQMKLPNISRLFQNGFVASIVPPFPAVTCTVQATITSGYHASDHGIISNGFFDRATNQVSFWEQSAAMVEKPRVWDILKKTNPKLKTAVLFWQNSLYANSDIVITPKPLHLENQMIMWCYSKPVGYYEEIAEKIGEFDLKWYWGPFSSIKSSEWIINAALYTIEKEKPDLTLVYLPHLDYAAQKYGPDSNEFRQSLLEIDKLIGKMLVELEKLHLYGDMEFMLLSEYGFNKVSNSVSPNIILRDKGFLSTRIIAGKEYIDYEYSKAFAMVDHQIAHVFIKPGFEDEVKSILKRTEGIEKILDKNEKEQYKINHPKSGELIICAENNTWFNYYWWNDVKYAPSFTFTVDIHRKPGYDPLELFLDPTTKRISHNTRLIKGSHGIVKNEVDSLPIFAISTNQSVKSDSFNSTQIAPTICRFFGVSNTFPEKPIF